MRKILNLLVSLLTNTIGKIDIPYCDKEFNLNDYFKIEKELEKLQVPFAVAVVSTYGFGSNLLIKFASSVSKDKKKRKSKATHAVVYIDLREGKKRRIIEAVDGGVQESSLLSAIGQRDFVKIRVPNKKVLNDAVARNALEYVHYLLNKDEERNIEYDFAHNIKNDSKLDCAEIAYRSLVYGYQKAGQIPLVKPSIRFGQETFSPSDLEHSPLFVTIYDSEKGFVDGDI